jgi:hypothetical protein
VRASKLSSVQKYMYLHRHACGSAEGVDSSIVRCLPNARLEPRGDEDQRSFPELARESSTMYIVDRMERSEQTPSWQDGQLMPEVAHIVPSRLRAET